MNPGTGDIQRFSDPEIAKLFGYTVPLEEAEAQRLLRVPAERRLEELRSSGGVQRMRLGGTGHKNRFKQRPRVSR